MRFSDIPMTKRLIGQRSVLDSTLFQTALSWTQCIQDCAQFVSTLSGTLLSLTQEKSSRSKITDISGRKHKFATFCQEEIFRILDCLDKAKNVPTEQQSIEDESSKSPQKRRHSENTWWPLAVPDFVHLITLLSIKLDKGIRETKNFPIYKLKSFVKHVKIIFLI